MCKRISFHCKVSACGWCPMNRITTAYGVGSYATADLWDNPIPVNARPVAITVVTCFLYLATAIAAVIGISLLFPNALLDRLWELNPAGAALFTRLDVYPASFFWCWDAAPSLRLVACSVEIAGHGGLRWYCSRRMSQEIS